MERKIKAVEKPWWIKKGGGLFRLSNLKMIRPGIKFQAWEKDIPLAFRDQVIPLSPITTPAEKEKEIEEVAVVAEEYKLQPRSGGGWFDVVSKTGKVINEKALKQVAAEQLLNSLKG